MDRFKRNYMMAMADAISTNKKCYEKIDKAYGKNPEKYEKIYRENKFAKFNAAKDGTLSQDYYFSKIIPLLIASSEDALNKKFNTDEERIQNENEVRECTKDVVEIIKAGFRYAYTYIEQRNRFDADEYLKAFIKKRNGLDNVTDIELINNTMISIFIATLLCKDINTKSELYQRAINIIDGVDKKKVSNDIFQLSRDEKKKIQWLKQQIKIREKIYPHSVLLHEGSDYLINSVEDIESIPDDYKTYILYDHVLTGTLCNQDVIKITEEAKLSEKDLDTLISYYLRFFKCDDDISGLEKYLYNATIYVRIMKAYELAKKFSLNTIEKPKDNKIIELGKELEKERQKSTLLEEQLLNLKKENLRLSKCIGNKNSFEKELFALREMMFNGTEPEDESFDETNYTDKIESLKQFKITVVGGHQSWQRRMKDIFPKFRYIGTSNYNFDGNLIKNADYVVINSRSIGHSLYYRAVSFLDENSNVIALNNKNIGLTINKIFNKTSSM